MLAAASGLRKKVHQRPVSGKLEAGTVWRCLEFAEVCAERMGESGMPSSTGVRGHLGAGFGEAVGLGTRGI